MPRSRIAGSAFADYFRNLSQGDPTAVVLTTIFLALFTFVGAVWLYDRRSQKMGKTRS